jgi:hypothetical protein
MRNNLELGLLRNVNKENILKVLPGFQTFGPQEVKIPVKLIITTNGIHELSDFRPVGAINRLAYGRTIEYADNSFAEVRISFNPKFAKMVI